MKTSRFILFAVTALLMAFIVAFMAALFGMAIAPEHAAAFGYFGGGVSLFRSALNLVGPPRIIGFRSDPLAGIAPTGSIERTLYARAMDEQMRLGFNPIMTPGYIRSEAILPATTNGFTFAVRSDETFNGAAIQPQEQRLNINDAFYVSHMSVMFYAFTTAGGNPARVRAKLQTFANDKVFTAAGALEIGAAYNGNLSLRVNATQFIENLDMNAFMFSEYAEQGLAVSAVAVTGVNGQNTWRQNEAFKPMLDPLIRLNGPSKNIFTLSFPDTISGAAFGAGVQGVAVLYLRGWKAQNSGASRS